MKEFGPSSGENPTTKEILIPRFGVITISGRSGTGKTAVAEALAQMYSIPPERNIKTGQLFRNISQSGQEIQGFYEREEFIDHEMDKRQRELIQASSPDSPLMLEGRLAGFIASQEKLSNPRLENEVISLLFTAPTRVRMKRILKRYLNDKNREIEQALLNMASPDEIEKMYGGLREQKRTMTTEWITNMERKRERKDLARWRKVHKQLTGIDPFSPNNRDNKGNKIYNFVIPTGTKTVAQVAEAINEILIANGYVEKDMGSQIPRTTTIFQAQV